MTDAERSLDDWLRWLETLNPREMDLGLERVGQVWRAMGSPRPPRVITVAGTNGKGSTVATLESLLVHAGLRVASYTSPHIAVFNERIRVDREMASDDAIIAAFEVIEAARGSVPLTYFEFGTLAALVVAVRAGVEFMVLEVGLGGRLDAVNIVDADVAIVTTIAFDHQDWLGDDLVTIAGEKLGIARAGRPLVIGDPTNPGELYQQGLQTGATVYMAGRDFRQTAQSDGWVLANDALGERAYARPRLPGSFQYNNAAAAMVALQTLGALPTDPAVVNRALGDVQLAARCERHLLAGGEIMFDVAHNPQAAAALAEVLAKEPQPTHAVLGMLSDKDAAAVVKALDHVIDRWSLISLDGPRGLSAAELAERIEADVPAGLDINRQDDRAAFLDQCIRDMVTARAVPSRIVFLGSFLTVGLARSALQRVQAALSSDDAAEGEY